jgi:hypothetical protein
MGDERALVSMEMQGTTLSLTKVVANANDMLVVCVLHSTGYHKGVIGIQA